MIVVTRDRMVRERVVSLQETSPGRSDCLRNY